ncbi:MAG: MGMT family protein [Desulfomonile tiedjei]|nr:MGMT family protein [Desulfomonile tiedjei]
MKNSRKPWAEKLRPDMEPKTVEAPRGGGIMLVPTPMLVAEEIKKVPFGDVVAVDELRQRLAARFQADLTCPLTTGIFINIIAGATEEDLAKGAAITAPYWRVVKKNGLLLEKIPPGAARQAEHLRNEGHAVQQVKGVWRLVVGSE